MFKRISLAALLLASLATFAQQRPTPLRPGHTFSIVARDPQTGEMGVAVQSHWFCVGCSVAWAEAGVGAIATQSFIDPSYGKLGLELMRTGKSAPEALNALILADGGREVRQVAFIDSNGEVATFTGEKCIADAGQVVGRGTDSKMELTFTVGSMKLMSELTVGRGRDFSVQANMMLNDKVWPAMAKAYQETKGDLADRMMAALDAAQAAGGDIRGRQSAAIIVVKPKSTGKPWNDRIFDLRVDDSPEPLKELRRLITVQRAYNHMNAGDLAVEHKDNEGALREYSAASKFVPDNLEMLYWHAVALVTMNRVDESLPLFRKVFQGDPNWIELTRRLPKAGLLPEDPNLIDRITSAAK